MTHTPHKRRAQADKLPENRLVQYKSHQIELIGLHTSIFWGYRKINYLICSAVQTEYLVAISVYIMQKRVLQIEILSDFDFLTKTSSKS